LEIENGLLERNKIALQPPCEEWTMLFLTKNVEGENPLQNPRRINSTGRLSQCIFDFPGPSR
jgi:hypothetical protein